jgi:hypothetical protein
VIHTIIITTMTIFLGGVGPAGAFSAYTSRLITSNTFKNVRDIAKGLNSLMPDDIKVRNMFF